MNTKYIFPFALSAVLMASCADNENPVDVTSGFETITGIKPDSRQTWQTASQGSITVAVPAAGTVNIYCEDADKRIVLSTAILSGGSKTINFDIPEHLASDVEIYGLDENEESVVIGTVSRDIMVEFVQHNVSLSDTKPDDFLPKRISLQEVNEGANVAFSKSSAARVATRATSDKAVNETPNKAELTGESQAKIYGYATFPGDILTDLLTALPEGNDTKAKACVNNFEMISNGKFLVSMFYGITGNAEREVGYYYYEGSQIKYVPFCDALKYDFLYDGEDYTAEDPISKTQVRKEGQWYDVNYDHYDRASGYTNTNKAQSKYHKGDQTYVIADEYSRSLTKGVTSIDEVRGVTFIVDVPVGQKFGLYCSGKDGRYDSGKSVFFNHTETANNKTYDTSGKFTSAMRVYNGYRFIGLEDTYKPSANQADCNDVSFVIVPGGNMPDIRLPYIVDNTTGMYYNGDGTLTATPKKDVLTDGSFTEQQLPSTETELAESTNGKTVWTMGFEDMGVMGDYDLNDLVIKIIPMPEVSKAQVTVCAVGGTNDIDLYYDGQLLGEAHDLLGIARGTMSNTSNTSQVDEKIVGYVDWPEGKSMSQNASDFYIISKGLKTTVPTSPGQTPTAIAIASEWSWPTEKVCVSKAYPQFGNWGANYQDRNYTNWYTLPSEYLVIKKAGY